MQDISKELKQHPHYWGLHKQIWTEEFNNLDYKAAAKVMDNPSCTEAEQMNIKVSLRIKDSLLHPA
jgi:hypothetical protein